MAYTDEVLSDSPVLYWHLDETSGPTAADASGNSRTGTYNGSPTFSEAGLITAGTSVLLSASDYCINGAALNISSATVEVWFDYSGTPPANSSFVAGFTEGLNGGVGDKILFINTVGNIAFYVYDGAQIVCSGDDVLSAGVHHFVGTIDDTANELKVYIDGEQTGTTVTANSSYAGYTAANVLVGGTSNALTGLGGHGLTGRRDEFAIYNTALSAARIAAHYAAGIASPGQILAPSTDSVDGSWTDQSGGTSLAAAIDEASFNDADYIRSELNPSASGCRVKLAAGGDPHVSNDHIIHWRTGKIGSATINMTVKLYQGGGNSQGAGTLIASFDRNNVGSLTTYDETLSGGEADSITDYTDLYLEFFANTA